MINILNEKSIKLSVIDNSIPISINKSDEELNKEILAIHLINQK